MEAWLAKNKHVLEYAGPYGSKGTALAVESAIIDAWSPRFNRVPGHGPRFRRAGVPARLVDRRSLDQLSVADLGKVTGGALLVYLSGGDFLADGRPKFNPADPDDDIAVLSIQEAWALSSCLEQWRASPSSQPRVLLGLYGPPEYRFVVAAAEIDPTGGLRTSSCDRTGGGCRW